MANISISTWLEVIRPALLPYQTNNRKIGLFREHSTDEIVLYISNPNDCISAIERWPLLSHLEITCFSTNEIIEMIVDRCKAKFSPRLADMSEEYEDAIKAQEIMDELNG